jgi:CHAT domain-containing protein/tetratricopeptide (TPR) repeat protein
MPLKLEAKQTVRLLVGVQAGECARIELRLKGGILSVEAGEQARWPIDLGRGGQLVYIVRGDSISDGGTREDSFMDVTSMERQRPAEVDVEWVARGACTSDELELQAAENDVARAEAARRHWKDAPSGTDAVELYQHADAIAAKLKNIPLQRLVETQYARYLLFQQTRFGEAEALLQRASALPSGDAAAGVAEEALTYKTLSSVEADLANYGAAIAAADKALALYRATGDVYWQGIVLGNVSSVYAALGQYREAAAAASEALADAKSQKDAAGVVYCLAQLANTYRLEGNFEAAFRAFREGIEWVGGIGYSPLVEAEIRDQMGSYYASLGEWSEASDELTRCLKLEGERDDPTALEARGTLAAVLEQQHRVAEADVAYSAAIETARRLKLPREETLLLVHRAHERLGLKREDEALSDIAAARQAAAGLSSPAMGLQLALASGDAWRVRDPVRSEEFYVTARGLAQQIGDRESQAAALAGIVAVEHAQHHDLDALSSIDEALKLLESTRSSLNSRELEVSYFSMHRSWYGLAIDVAMELAAGHPQGEYARRAFVYAERARARVLLDSVAAGGWHAESEAPASLKEALARNQHAIDDEQTALDGSDDHAIATASQALLKLYREQDALEAELKESQRKVAGHGGSLIESGVLEGQVAGVEEVQRGLLTENSALLAYWVGEETSYRWLVTKDAVEVLRLPGRQALEAQVLPLVHQLEMRQARPLAEEDAGHYALRSAKFESSVEERLTKAGQLLLKGLPATVQKVYVVSDGALFALPWNALRLHEMDGMHYAVERYLFLEEPSASVALQLRLHPEARLATRVAVVSDAGEIAQRRPGGVEEIALTSVVREAQRIKEAGGEGKSASVMLLAGRSGLPMLASSDFSVVHFAAHTVTIGGQAELTGIHFGSSHDGMDDTLWLHDIYAMKRMAPLVVMSGCATEGGMQLTGEGMNSLAQAFFFAGAHAVVGSLWRVDDEATSKLMGSLYHGMLVEHKDAADALRLAQLRMLRRGAKPVDWAAFVMNGLPAGREDRAE